MQEPVHPYPSYPALCRQDTTYSQNDDYGPFVAKYPGALGNSLKVSMCGAAKANTNSDGTLNANTDVALTGTVSWTQSGGSLAGSGTAFNTELSVGDVIVLGGQTLVILTVNGNTLATAGSAYGSDIGSGVAVRKMRSGFSEPSSQMIGTATVSANGTIITGTDTQFSTQLNVGDIVTIGATTDERKVIAISSAPSSSSSFLSFYFPLLRSSSSIFFLLFPSSTSSSSFFLLSSFVPSFFLRPCSCLPSSFFLLLLGVSISGFLWRVPSPALACGSAGATWQLQLGMSVALLLPPNFQKRI